MHLFYRKFQNITVLRRSILFIACAVCILCLSPGSRTLASIEMPGPEEQFELPQPHFGDLDKMIERRVIRVLTCYNLTNYFFDGADQRGLTYELMREFENDINKKAGNPTVRIHVLMVPVARDELLKALAEGRGDIAAANLTITDERLKEVDFAAPFAEEVKEVVVTGPGNTVVSSLEDLSGREVHVRKSSSFYTHLVKLNEDFASRGIEPVVIKEVDEYLETEDILEMVAAGLIPRTVTDDHTALFWKKYLPDLKVNEEVAINVGGNIAWAVRKDCPQLIEAINVFVKKYKVGTRMGNILARRYYDSNKWVKNSLEGASVQRFNQAAPIFKKYADKYDFDYLMLLAQGYQESRLNQTLVSPRGAVGVMQLLPTTAADPSVGIKDITVLDNNIHAGVKYLNHIEEVYLNDPGLDKLNRTLFAFAAYNAGPNRIARLREKAAGMNLNPDIWFGNVEHVVAREVGRETVNYVRNIAKYYYAYRMSQDRVDRMNAKKGKKAKK